MKHGKNGNFIQSATCIGRRWHTIGLLIGLFLKILHETPVFRVAKAEKIWLKPEI